MKYFRVYMDVTLGPFKNEQVFPMGHEIRHAAQLISAKYEGGGHELFKDRRVAPDGFSNMQDFKEEVQCIHDAFGHLSTGGNREVHEELLKDAYFLLGYLLKQVGQ